VALLPTCPYCNEEYEGDWMIHAKTCPNLPEKYRKRLRILELEPAKLVRTPQYRRETRKPYSVEFDFAESGSAVMRGEIERIKIELESPLIPAPTTIHFRHKGKLRTMKIMID